MNIHLGKQTYRQTEILLNKQTEKRKKIVDWQRDFYKANKQVIRKTWTFSFFPVYFPYIGVPTFEKVWSTHGSIFFQGISMVAGIQHIEHILFYNFFSNFICFIKKCFFLFICVFVYLCSLPLFLCPSFLNTCNLVNFGPILTCCTFLKSADWGEFNGNHYRIAVL